MKTILTVLIATCWLSSSSAQPKKGQPKKEVPKPPTANELEAKIRNLELELENAKKELAKIKLQNVRRINISQMEVGQTAIFHVTEPVTPNSSRRVDVPLQVRIEEINDGNSKRVKLLTANVEYIIKGESTKGVVTGKVLVLSTPYKVIATEKVGGDTLFVLSPAEVPGNEVGLQRWRYAKEHGSGYFEKQKDGSWIEIGRDGKQVSVWAEKSKTEEYVELIDEKRGYLTRLGVGKAWLASTKDGKFNPSPNGDCEK